MDGPITIGVDPSLRHVGLCMRAQQLDLSPRFWEIQTGDLSVWAAGRQMQRELDHIFGNYLNPFGVSLVVGMERQVPHSGILFYAQMKILEVLMNWFGTTHEHSVRFVLPLPVQLKSFMKKRMTLNTESKLSIVNGVKQMLCYDLKTRLSSHKAEAYCVALMAEDVVAGKWPLKLPEKETHLIPEMMIVGG